MDKQKYVDCIGISSKVKESKNGKTKGHVLFLDAEKNTDRKIIDIINRLKQKLDVFMVLESSKDSYHVINPVIRSQDDTFRLMAQFNFEDYQHTAIGYKRDSWVLRFTQKGYKSAPTPIAVYNDLNESKVVSEPHIRFVNDIYNHCFFKNSKDSMMYLDGVLTVEKYTTYNKPLKKYLRGGN